MTAASGRLYRRYRTSPAEERGPLRLVFLGTLLTTLIGSTFNIALVALGNARLIGWGPVATIIALPVTADPEKIHEVVMNLVDNAITYSSAGTVDIVLQPTVRDGRQILALSVTDQGIGIMLEDLPPLFSKFVRTDAATQARPEGMDLGLYLVKKVVEDHQGRVSARSPGPAKGSTFVVELPAAEGGQRPLDIPAAKDRATGTSHT